MEQSPAWEANRFSSSQAISRILWNPKVHYRIHTCPYPESVRSSPHPHIPLSIPRTKSHVPFSLLRPYQSISPGPRLSVWTFRNKIRFYGEELLAPRPTPSWRTTPCRLSATAYSIYSQLPSMLEAVPPSATWVRAIGWWQGPTYHLSNYIKFNKIL